MSGLNTIGFQELLLRIIDFRWTGDGGDEEDGFGNNGGAGGTNATFLEAAVATFLDSVPLQVPFLLLPTFALGLNFEWTFHFIKSLPRPRSN